MGREIENAEIGDEKMGWSSSASASSSYASSSSSASSSYASSSSNLSSISSELPLLSLNHVSFVCKSVPKSVKFYEEVLGFVLIKRPSSFEFEGAWYYYYFLLSLSLSLYSIFFSYFLSPLHYMAFIFFSLMKNLSFLAFKKILSQTSFSFPFFIFLHPLWVFMLFFFFWNIWLNSQTFCKSNHFLVFYFQK